MKSTRSLESAATKFISTNREVSAYYDEHENSGTVISQLVIY